MSQTEVLGATQVVDPQPETDADDLERAVLESETISSTGTASGAGEDLLSAMTRTLVPGTVALAPDSAGPDTQIDVENSGAPDDRSGDVIHGRYKLVRQLGKGGMGTVYIAKHTTLPKTFAVKVLNARYAKRLDIAERFLQEARAVSLIDHENVVGVIDFGREDDGSAFLVMEHLRGESLGAMCKREAPLAWPRVQHIMLQLCRALAAAHAVGVVHRDIKPDNVLRVERGDDPDYIKVLDFGLAKLQVAGGLRLTATGMVLGTPDYMSPEQARGLQSDHRADIYAAGIMMYELLCGRVPFQATTFAAIRQKHLLEPPEPPSKWVPELSPEIDAIVLRALAKDPEHRFASMAEMGAAIEAVGTGKPPVEVLERRTLPLLAERSLIAAPGHKSGKSALPETKLLAPTQAAAGAEPPMVESSIEGQPRALGRWAVAAFALALVFGGGAALLASGVLERSSAPVVEPTPAAVAVAETPSSVPTSVTVRFETNVPVVVRDLEGNTPFGAAPTHELRMPTSDQSLRLVLAAEGYRELHVVVTPDRDQVLEATLERQPEAAPDADAAAPAPTEVSDEARSGRATRPRGKPSTTSDAAAEPAAEPASEPKSTGETGHSFAPEIRDPFGG